MNALYPRAAESTLMLYNLSDPSAREQTGETSEART
jgi:hypothetical protein